MHHAANERGRQSRPVAWPGFNPLVRSRIALLSLAAISTLFRHSARHVWELWLASLIEHRLSI